MAEYIEREAALLEIEEWADTFCECDYVWPHVIKSIRKLPAADVRPVVLCKDCKHYEQLDLFRNSPVWSGMCHYWNNHATCEDGFCFKAAKKERT